MSRRSERFRQARWNEPVIFELDSPGECGIEVPRVSEEIRQAVGDGLSQLPDAIRRKTAPRLPRLGQMRILKHDLHLHLRLSQETLGADLNVGVGTMYFDEIRLV